ncbi:hypothetical protein FQN57_004774 [Myotisia sp. PD_48]|nr:hypothetical protein FQN57_004774 [Myotisia sp. PD_48]
MDPIARFKILFEGDNEALNAENIGLQPPSIVQASTTPKPLTLTPLPSPPTVATQNQSEKAVLTVNNDTGGSDNSDDTLYQDEYLASFRDADEKQRRSRMKSKIPMDRRAQLPDSNSKLSTENVRYFCPLVAISRFPYKYIHSSKADRVAKGYFDGGKFWNLTWDIYYINPPADIALKPILLVPQSQVQNLLDSICNDLGFKLSIPSDESQGVSIPFTEDGTPQPVYLGVSTSRDMKEKFERTASISNNGQFELPQNASGKLKRAFALYKEKILRATNANRQKNKSGKIKKKHTQTQKAKFWYRGLKRTQCYLGLRPRLSRDVSRTNTASADKTWAEQQAADKEYALQNGIALYPLDINEPAPYVFADEPIFVSIDVESNERCHTQITEIGLSVLDTLDLTAIPPGQDGYNWMNKIRSRHFRISEYASVVNRDFVSGCPDKFEFGESEWISVREVRAAIDSCFQPPYSGHVMYSSMEGTTALELASRVSTDGGVKLSEDENEKKEETVNDKILLGHRAGSNEINTYKKLKRNVVLVGHDLSGDIRYLARLGCETFKGYEESLASQNSNIALPHFIDAIDTNRLFRVLKRDFQPSSLSKVLLDVGIPGWNLHNAGNDARYTLEAMIAIALKARFRSDHEGGIDPGALDETMSTASVTDITGKTFAPDDLMASMSLDDHPDGRPTCSSRSAGWAKDKAKAAWKAEIERRVAAKKEQSEAIVRDECAAWESVMSADWDVAEYDDLDGGATRRIGKDFFEYA